MLQDMETLKILPYLLVLFNAIIEDLSQQSWANIFRKMKHCLFLVRENYHVDVYFLRCEAIEHPSQHPGTNQTLWFWC